MKHTEVNQISNFNSKFIAKVSNAVVTSEKGRGKFSHDSRIGILPM